MNSPPQINYEIMSYKERKKENELMVKLEIIRKKIIQKKSRKNISKAYLCSESTLKRILNDFKNKISPEHKSIILDPKKSFSLEEIEQLLSPLKSVSTRPKSNKKQASASQENLIKKMFLEKKIKIGYQRMVRLIQRLVPEKNHQFLSKSEIILLKSLSFAQMKGIYKRNKFRSKKVKTVNRQRKPLHDYELTFLNKPEK